jgi:ribokinase
VNTKYVVQTKGVASGVALITVDAAGNNVIVVAAGANQKLSAEDVREAESSIASSGALVAQLEIPVETVEFAGRLAHNCGVPFILDPAPAQKLGPELLKMVEVLTPNETEAQILTGIEVTDGESARSAAETLLRFGVKAVILTMGAKGFLLARNEKMEFVDAIKVEAVDATAAGDAFAGGLAFGLAQGQGLLEAALFANRVAALSVVKMGAQSSMPTREAVEGFMK